MRSLKSPSTEDQISQGDYLCSAHELYHVEHVADGHVLLEDCRSGELVDVPIAQVLSLTRLPEPIEGPSGRPPPVSVPLRADD